MPEHEKNMEAIAEEQIVNDILKNLQMIDGHTRNISYGSKDMDLYVFEEKNRAESTDLAHFETSIENIKGEEQKRPKETRLLYKAAKKFFQEYVNDHGDAMHYYMDTRNPKLLEFARTHGKEIFNWDHEPTDEDVAEGRHHFAKAFKPETNE